MFKNLRNTCRFALLQRQRRLRAQFFDHLCLPRDALGHGL